MSYLVFGGLGWLLLLVTLGDVVTTTLIFNSRGGLLTRYVAKALWRTAGHALRGGSAAKYVGPLILGLTVAVWLLLTWVAWLLIFYGAQDAVLSAESGQPAGLVARLYFAGFSLFTLGVGDYVPKEGVWQVLTAVSSAIGFAIITLSITFVLPVVQSVTERRALANQVNGWGDTPEQVLVRHWNGSDFGPLETRLLNLSSTLTLLEQRHYTYPVLHHYVESERTVSAVVAVAKLSETLLLLRRVEATARPSEVVMEDLQKVIDRYLAAVRRVHSLPKVSEPPRPDISSVGACGIPLAGSSQAEEDADRRQTLKAVTMLNGWSWDDVATIRDKTR